MAGLPLSAWVLLAAAVGIGLALEIAFYRAHRGRNSETDSADATGPGR